MDGGRDGDQDPMEGADDGANEFPDGEGNYEEVGEDEEPVEGANDEGDVDQYFDDAGDIGYLPADHVTSLLVTLLPASDEQAPKCPHEAADG